MAKETSTLNVRIGLGFDVHKLVEGRPCKLGGIVLEHDKGPLGHSDGDAILHAIADAVLGATALDDLGTLFSDKDPKWKEADSALILAECLKLARRAGWELGNVDIVVATEGPRIAPHRLAMCQRIAQICGVRSDAVNVKGKTLEGLGALAGGTGVAVQAVCLMTRA